MSTETTTRPAEAMAASEAEVRPNGHPSVTELLARVMADVTHVGKDGYNKTQSYNFRGIDAVVNAVGPAFRAHGIVPKPILKDVTYENILVGEKRTPMTRCTVKVKYRFKGPGGDFEDVTVPGEAFDSGDKGTAKAMSVAYRIALLQLLALPTTEPDPDESSYERAPAAVTDQRWLAQVRQRIAAAADRDALNLIGEDISAHADAGQLSMVDGDRLRAEFDGRWAALATPAAPAADGGWSSAPLQDRPAERHHGPVDDEWNTATGQPLAPPAPGMPAVTGEQLGEIARLLKVKRGATNGDRNAIISQLVQRPVENVQTLSESEARSIIDTLTAEPNLTAPDAPAESGPAPAPPPVGSPDNPKITDRQQKMMHSLLNQAGYGERIKGLALISRLAGRDVTSSSKLSKAEAGVIITRLTTGEVPEPSGPPASDPAPPGPDPSGEGISEFDVIDQMILDVASDEAVAEVKKAIADELARGSITQSDSGLLLERLSAHVQQAKADAST